MTGGTGLLHLEDPLASAPGTFRVSLLFDTYKGSGFLCNAGTPCPGVTEDLASHYGTTVNLAVAPLPFLEAYASLDSYVNSNDARSPSVISAVGNTTFAVKGFTPEPLAKFLRLGAAVEVGFLSSAGGVGIAGSGTSLRALALAQTDFRGPDGRGVPLRARLNAGYFLDNSANLVEAVERERGGPVTRIERFGLDINRVDQFQLGIGVDGLFGVVRPFAEWNVGVPVNRQGYTCYPQRSFSGDGCLGTDAKFSAFPSKLTLGARVFPWLPGLSATAAFDIGTSGTSNFIEELSPTMPWALWLGIGYGIDTVPPAPVVVEKPVERVVVAKGPPDLRVRGFVHPENSQDPVPKAVVGYDGRNLTGMITMADGHFVSGPLEPGTYTFSIEATGFERGECQATVAADAPHASGAESGAAVAPHFTDVDCALKALPPFGTLTGRVLDRATSTPVAGANATLRDGVGREASVATDATGAFHFDHLPPGTLTLTVDAPGYLFRGEPVRIEAREDARLDVGVVKTPKVPHVRKTRAGLALQQSVRFDDADQPATESLGMLEEAADVLVRSVPDKHVEIRVYTDASGDAANDQAQTERRATALRDWFVAHGVPVARLTARGFGSGHPVSPNVTAAGRARNRRVELVFAE